MTAERREQGDAAVGIEREILIARRRHHGDGKRSWSPCTEFGSAPGHDGAVDVRLGREGGQFSGRRGVLRRSH